MRNNFRHLYWDVFWFGVLTGSTMTFMAIYASRQGANAYQVGLLTASPAVINLALSLPAGRWLQNRSLIRISYVTAFWHRLAYVLLIFLPGLLTPAFQLNSLVFLIAVMSVPGAFLAIAFNAMFADVIPPESRGEVVGRRNAILAISIVISTLVCGQLLDRLPDPINYRVVFAIGSVGAMASTYHLWRLRPAKDQTPVRIGKPLMDFARPGSMRFLDVFRAPIGLRFLTRGSGKPLIRKEVLLGSYGTFMLSCLIFYAAQYIPIPLFPIFSVRDLNLSDGQISLGTSLFYVSMLLMSLQIRWLSARLGHRKVLLIGSLCYGIYPLVLSFASDVRLYLVASLLSGANWALLNAGLVNRLMERASANERPVYMALHNMVLNFGILAGSLIGPGLVAVLDLRQAIFLSAGLRLLGGLFFVLWG
jgi:MFS family permease